MLFMQFFCNSTQTREKLFCCCDSFLRNSVLRSCFWSTKSLFFFCVWPPFFFFFWRGRSWCIYCGATEKDLGYFGLWDGISTQAYKYGSVELWVLHSIAQRSTNKQVFRMIQAYQLLFSQIIRFRTVCPCEIQNFPRTTPKSQNLTEITPAVALPRGLLSQRGGGYHQKTPAPLLPTQYAPQILLPR